MFIRSSAVLAIAAYASATLSSRATNTTAGSIVPGAYIVRFAPGHVSIPRSYITIQSSRLMST